MRTTQSARELGGSLQPWRKSGETIALVPTMGDLHAGHMELVREARRRAARVVVSVFVNPLQFDDASDLAAYPRNLQGDSARLAEAGVDLLYAPTVQEVYPHGMQAGTRVEVPGLSAVLCGRFRPGHFTGVATVVAILFSTVRPDIALFGEKDYQQLLIVRRMTEDLRLGVQIVGMRTVREPDGLALSSRNRYLKEDERSRAPELQRTLSDICERVVAGARDFPALEAAAAERLRAAGFRPEYVSIRRATDLSEPEPGDRRLRVLAAAWLGSARLIDNLPIDLPG